MEYLNGPNPQPLPNVGGRRLGARNQNEFASWIEIFRGMS